MIEPIQMAVIAVAALSLYSYRADFGKYSIFTVGAFKRLNRSVVEDAEYECGEYHCDEQTPIAERRTYYKEIVVAGMPLLRYDRGVSHYCENHVSFEAHDKLDEPDRSRVERLGIPIAAAITEFLEWKVALEEPDTEQDPFDDVVASTQTALSLIPIVIIVLLAVSVMGAMERAMPE